MIFLPFGPRSFFGAKNGIREGCQKCLGFEYQKLIDSMNFVPFGPRSFFGAKKGIREGCQKCLRFEYQKLIDSMNFLPFGLRFLCQKSDPRGVPEVLGILNTKNLSIQ